MVDPLVSLSASALQFALQRRRREFPDPFMKTRIGAQGDGGMQFSVSKVERMSIAVQFDNQPATNAYPGAPIRLLRTAKIKSLLNSAEGLIVVKQLSSNFAWFDSWHTLLVGEAVEMDFDGRGSLEGIVTDRMKNSYLVQFTGDCDPLSHLDPAVDADGRTGRRPRIAAGVPITLHAKGALFTGQMIDLSFGGAKILVDAEVPEDCGIEIHAWGRQSINARIAWQEKGEIGVAFDRKLSIQELRVWAG